MSAPPESLAATLLREPDSVRAVADDLPPMELMPAGHSRWHSAVLELRVRPTGPAVHVTLESTLVPIAHVELRWRRPTSPEALLVGDALGPLREPLAWRPLDPARWHHWQVLLHQDGVTHSAGVRCADLNAIARWRVTAEEIVLRLDTRSGGRGVLPPDAPMELASLTARDGAAIESPFDSARHLCGMLARGAGVVPLCEAMVGVRVGADALTVAESARMAVELCEASKCRPWVIVDASASPEVLHELARQIKQAGARPGITYRPLIAGAAVPELYSRFASGAGSSHMRLLDPSVPDALELIAGDVRRFREMGFELLEHEHTALDTLGNDDTQGNDGQSTVTFADDSRTSATILRSLYRTIRSAADDLVIVARGAVGHLSAGCADVVAIGDGSAVSRGSAGDVNALAFRLAQHAQLFAVDAGTITIAPGRPWYVTREWLDLVSHSGTPLFVRLDPTQITDDHKAALREAFAVVTTSHSAAGAEPLDWLGTAMPRVWKIQTLSRSFDWGL